MTTTASEPVASGGPATGFGSITRSGPTPRTGPARGSGPTDSQTVLDAWQVVPVPRCEPDPLGTGTAPVCAIDPPAARPRPTMPGVADGIDVEMRQFAIGAIKLVLEVMNRRRPVGHLTTVAIPHITDQFRTLLSSGTDRGAPPATLLRVHTQSVRPDAAEITVVYGRGSRVLAMGARVELRTVVVRPAVPGTARRRERRHRLVAVTVG